MNTPAPWLIADDEQKTFIYALNEDGTNRFDLSVRRGYEQQPKHGEGVRTSTEEIQANARLIAAAPDLLEALNMTDLSLHIADERGPCLCSQCVFRKAAKVAIAKATQP